MYRLRVNTKDNNYIYSTQKRVVIKFNDLFTIYPNPASDKVIIKGSIGKRAIIRLTDINGREIIKIITTNTSSSSWEFLLPPVEPGIYLLHVNNYREKIFILH